MNRILFLCSGNYYRSRFAEEVFNFRARAASSNWSADSRGLRLNIKNVGRISKVALKRMDRLGIIPNNGSRTPEMVRESDFKESAVVIAMSREEHYPLMRRLFPAYAEQISYWDVEDTGEMLPNVGLLRIEALVDRLIEDVHHGPAPELD